MHHLKWVAVPVAAVALIFLVFGLIWTGAVQLAIAAALLAIAAAIWHTATGAWPLTTGSP